MKTEYISPLTIAQSCCVELELIPQIMREPEPGLMTTRWFDYRHLLPAQATLLFAERYDAIYREMYAKTRDSKAAEKVTTIFNGKIFRSTELLSLWRVRQAADRIGCKYDFYLRQVFKRAWDRGWRFLPRLNQMYDEETVLDIADIWQQETLCSLQVAKSKRFGLESYVGHPDQDAYHDYLIAEIKRREHPHLSLAGVVFRERVLPVEIAGKHFGGDALRRARFFA